jgi:host factor-I protein
MTVIGTRKECNMADEKAQSVQDGFLNTLSKNETHVTMFLVNGIKLQGCVLTFDKFAVLLERQGHIQLVYKHAISTVMPGSVVQKLDSVRDARPRTQGEGRPEGSLRRETLRAPVPAE